MTQPGSLGVYPRHDITGVVLAGGRATRMGGTDKGLVTLDGRTMVEFVVAGLKPQVGPLLVNANRNLGEYRRLCGCEVIEDRSADFAGPLAGMASALDAARTRFVLTAPCDSPLLSGDLAGRLYEALDSGDAEIGVAHDGRRMQPVFALLDRALLPSMQRFLDAGERKIDKWYAQHRVALADLSDRADTFLNVNTPEQRDRLAARIAGEAAC